MIDQDFIIDFNNKIISYNVSGSGTTYTMNQLYSFLQDTFDEPDAMDDDIPIKALPKNKYTFINGWTVDDEGLKHLQDFRG